MFYRLMSWTVFAIAHRVVCENKNGGKLHQSRQPDCWPCIVAKDEERCSVRTQLGQRKAIYNRTHRVLADAEVQIFPCPVIGLEVSRALVRESSLVRWSEIR